MAPKAAKRRLEDEGPPAPKERRGGNERAERLASSLAGLNGQFASWVAANKEANLHKFWIEGVCDYIKYAQKLLDEHKDLLPADGVATLQQTAADVEDGGRTAAGGFGPLGAMPSAGFFGASASQPAAASKGAAPVAAEISSVLPLFGAATAPSFGTSTAGGFSSGAFSSIPASTTGAGATAGKDTGAAEGAGLFSFSTAAKDNAAPAAGDALVGTAGFPKPPFAAAGTSTAGFGVVSSETTAPTASKPFSFGVTGGSSACAATTASSSGSLFSGAASSSAVASSAALVGSIFGGAVAGATTGFSFGGAPSSSDAAAVAGGKKDSAAGAAASSSAASGFLFAGQTAGATMTTAGGATGFSLGASAGSTPGLAFGAPAGGGGNEDEAEEPEPEPDECAKEPSLKVDDNVEFLFKEKARLQVPVKADGKLAGWEARGVGMLSIRRAKTEGAKPYIALFTDSGRCLYQAYFNKTMKIVVSDKQKSVAFTAAWSPDGTSPPALNAALFQLAPGKNHMFEAIIKKLQEEMVE